MSFSSEQVPTGCRVEVTSTQSKNPIHRETASASRNICTPWCGSNRTQQLPISGFAGAQLIEIKADLRGWEESAVQISHAPFVPGSSLG